MSAPIFRSAASRRRWARATAAFVVLAWLVVPWHLCQQAYASVPVAAAVTAAASHAPCDHCPGADDGNLAATASALHQTLCKAADAAFVGVEQHVPSAHAPPLPPIFVAIIEPFDGIAFDSPPPTPPPRLDRPLHLVKATLLI